MWFRINTPMIAHQTIDDETIIISFDTGAYFNTEGTGAGIWRSIDMGTPLQEIVATLCEHYPEQTAEIEMTVGDFIAELQREALIVPIPDAPRNSATKDAPQISIAFAPPVLHKYTDMAAMLLLDPIHDVNEQGWPYQKQ